MFLPTRRSVIAVSAAVLALVVAVAPAHSQLRRDIGAAKKAAAARAKDIDKEQKAINKQIHAITARIGRTKHLELDGAEQQALSAHWDALELEKVTIERILTAPEWDGTTPGTERISAERRATLRSVELTQLGQQLAMSLPPRIQNVVARRDQLHARLAAAQARRAPKAEIEILQRAASVIDKALITAENVPVAAAEYLAVVGALSLQQYEAQVRAIEQRRREESARRIRPEDAGAIVLGALGGAILAGSGISSDQLRADRGAAAGQCAILGGLFTPGTGSEVGTCSR